MMTSVSDGRQTWIKVCAVLNSKLIQGSASDSTQNRALGLIDKKGKKKQFSCGCQQFVTSLGQVCGPGGCCKVQDVAHGDLWAVEAPLGCLPYPDMKSEQG